MPQKWKVKIASTTERSISLATSSGVSPQRDIRQGGLERVFRFKGWVMAEN